MLLSILGAAMEAPVGDRPVSKPLELGKPCVTGACGCVPTAGGRQCLLEVPPGQQCSSGEH